MLDYLFDKTYDFKGGIGARIITSSIQNPISFSFAPVFELLYCHYISLGFLRCAAIFKELKGIQVKLTLFLSL